MSMPFKTIKTREYQCIRCEYRWIRRKNGKENRRMPKFCPECKTRLWNEKYVTKSRPWMEGMRGKKWYELPRGLRRLNKDKKP